MNLLNRIVIILLILVVMVLIPLVLILPEQAQAALQYAANIIQVNIEWLQALTPAAQIGVRLLLSAIGMGVFLVGLIFIVLEVIRIRRNTIKLKDGSGELMINSVASYLSYYVDLLPDVIRVKPSVQSKGNSVRASLYVETAPGISVPQKSAEIQQTARRVIEDELGLQTKGEIKVVIKPVPAPKSRRDRRAAAIPQPAEPVPTVEPVGPVEADGTRLEEIESSEVIEVKAPPESDE